jgi:hypothetical protein
MDVRKRVFYGFVSEKKNDDKSPCQPCPFGKARSQAKEGLKPTPTGDFPRLYAIHGFTKPYLPVAAYAGVNLFSPCLRQSQGRKE